MKHYTTTYLTTVDLSFSQEEIEVLLKAARLSQTVVRLVLAGEVINRGDKPGLLVYMRDQKRGEASTFRIHYKNLRLMETAAEVNRPSDWDSFTGAEKQLLVGLRADLRNLIAHLNATHPQPVIHDHSSSEPSPT